MNTSKSISFTVCKVCNELERLLMEKRSGYIEEQAIDIIKVVYKLGMQTSYLTNGEETYGDGRYIDLVIPEGDSITINFNKAYIPYCAYNAKYSCPIVPKENNLNYAIKAGVKNFNKPL